MQSCPLLPFLQELSTGFGADAELAAVLVQTIQGLNPERLTESALGELRHLADYIHSDGSPQFKEQLCDSDKNCTICKVVVDRLTELSRTSQ